jgi:Flp pilus assembly protein TadD
METLIVKYRTYAKVPPPQTIKFKIPGWAGVSEKMEQGALSQPWHCLPFTEGSTYGLELVYPYETECHVINDQGTVRIEFDYRNEPGGILMGGEFGYFSPRHAPKNYFFAPQIDIQTPPGYALRIEPHPRYFTDDTGTVPPALFAHLQSEWYPRLLFFAFRIPWPGQRHIFRQGEPYVQLLLVPRNLSYEITPMTPEEETQRRELDNAIKSSRSVLATNCRQDCDGTELDNHYKILAATYAEGGMAAVNEAVRAAVARQQQALPKEKTVPELLAVGAHLVKEQKYRDAKEIYLLALNREPKNAEALSQLGVCIVCMGHIELGVKTMVEAVALQPQMPKLHSSLGEVLRLLGRLPEAETEFRWSLHFNPHDAGVLSVLGLTLAQQGRLVEGLQTCRAALAMNGSVPAVHFRLGWIHAQQGQHREARAYYEAALSLNPAFAEARRALEALPSEARPQADS